MRILVVASKYPFPPETGSSILIYNQLKELSKKHSIYFVCSDACHSSDESYDFVEYVEIIHRKTTSRSKKWIRILGGSSPSVAGCWSGEMNQRVNQLLLGKNFDAILLYELTSIQYCPSSYFKKAVVNVEDPQSIKCKRMLSLSVLSFKDKIIWTLFSILSRRYESTSFPKFSKVLVLSRADMQDLKNQGCYRNIGYVPYGVEKRVDGDILNLKDRTDGMIIFSGNMFHPPNVDGILFFLKDIFKKILENEPRGKLWIVGANPDPRILEASKSFGDRIVITGRVVDVSHYLRRAKVSICPVRLKIGIQTKIMEALSWATPVVTTSAGNSGVNAQSGRELWVEDDPTRFAEKVIGLLRDKDWIELSQRGRKYVEKSFSWRQSAIELERHLELATRNG